MEDKYISEYIHIGLGTSPNKADLAIVSINEGAALGELNEFVLREYGYNNQILNKLSLSKGFDIVELDAKPILFIVTVGSGNTENNLRNNLFQAISINFEFLRNRKIWIPLMGTGIGGLSFSESYNITINILDALREYIIKFNCQFLISIPDNFEGEDLFSEITKNVYKHELINKTNFKGKIGDDRTSIILKNTNSTFYLVGSIWGDAGDQSQIFYEEGVWKNGYENGSYSEIINSIKVGDVIINKSTFATKGGKNYLRIKAFGIITENPKNGILLKVNWFFKLQNFIDIEGLSFYRDTITAPSIVDLKKIFSSLESGDFDELELIFSDTLRYIDSLENGLDLIDSSVTSLAGLISDSDVGIDYLEISKDVNAFAKVISAKSFEPPLAVAVLGKWGSGKSFFMRKLKEKIEDLSNNNRHQAYCDGIAHVHFNAWSYMDANLWASIVTRIFESLDNYIKSSVASEEEIKKIEEQLFQKLNISKEKLSLISIQKDKLEKKINLLELQQKHIQKELGSKISKIRQSTLIDIISKVNSEFNSVGKIETTLNENATFVNTAEKFEDIVPREYWINPTEFCNQFKSANTFIKAFFFRKNIAKNIGWLVLLLLLVLLAPVFTYLINLLLSWQDFTLTNTQWVYLSVYGTIFTRAIDTFLKLKRQIAPFWNLKETYEIEKRNALFKFSQEEKALKLEIDNSREEIILIDKQITANEELKINLEFKLKAATSTEALYNFIEKRANSEDYKKHLGIVSLIRKDFEILSGLLLGHNTELVTNKESKDFKDMFDKPLERIILYIDDLDRCPEERVVEVLEAINLLMAFPLFVVIVGVDPRWIKTSLIEKYNKQFLSEDVTDRITALNYLEKIFQIPFCLKDAGDVSIKHMIKSLVQVKPNLSNIDIKNNVEKVDDLSVKTDFNYALKNESQRETITITTALEDQNNYESIEVLEISESESEILQAMSEIIGNNPRAIKRFVNTYRIIKTHEDFNFYEKNKEGQLYAIAFLLALSLGKHNSCMKKFENFIGVTQYKEYTLDFLKVDLHIIYNIIENNTHIMKLTLDDFNRNYEFVKRFTFFNF